MKHNFKIHNMFYLGYVVLNSRTAYGKNKKNVTYYAFKPIYQEKQNELMIVPYKKSSKEEQTNVYIVATKNPNQQQSHHHIAMSVNQILGPVGSLEAEHKYLLCKHSLSPIRKKPIINPRQYYEDIIDEEISKRTVKTQAITIDPEGSQDHDDAVSITITDKDTMIIGVHIADVSFLISPDSQLDNYAKESYTTVYSSYLNPINMLPSYVCNELLSLKENGKRLCVSIYYHYKNNKHTNTTIARDSVIIVKNCTYENVRKHLTTDQWKALTIVTNTSDSHKIVETLMLQTNTFIARNLATKSPNTCILRAQKESMDDSIFFRSRANYIIGTTQDTLHHDLNEEYYTHFTSPLRRYADIIAHRQLFSKDYKVKEEIINKINDVNKRCSRLKSDEHKLQLIYDLENLWKQDQIALQLQAHVIDLEENSIYVHTKYKEKDFLLRIKTQEKIEKNQQIIIEIMPYLCSSIFSEKLKLKII
jgi:exoribonuclease R